MNEDDGHQISQNLTLCGLFLGTRVLLGIAWHCLDGARWPWRGIPRNGRNEGGGNAPVIRQEVDGSEC
jgi:hypothetical protein